MEQAVLHSRSHKDQAFQKAKTDGSRDRQLKMHGMQSLYQDMSYRGNKRGHIHNGRKMYQMLRLRQKMSAESQDIRHSVRSPSRKTLQQP